MAAAQRAEGAAYARRHVVSSCIGREARPDGRVRGCQQRRVARRLHVPQRHRQQRPRALRTNLPTNRCRDRQQLLLRISRLAACRTTASSSSAIVPSRRVRRPFGSALPPREHHHRRQATKHHDGLLKLRIATVKSHAARVVRAARTWCPLPPPAPRGPSSTSSATTPRRTSPPARAAWSEARAADARAHDRDCIPLPQRASAITDTIAARKVAAAAEMPSRSGPILWG